MYIIVITRKPYRNDNVTACNDNGWMWALLETRTNSSGGCYVYWFNRKLCCWNGSLYNVWSNDVDERYSTIW